MTTSFRAAPAVPPGPASGPGIDPAKAALAWTHTARFLTTASQLGQLPDSALPEIAFVGRSNAGKSTAINRLAQQKRLAFASRTPGRTQHINLFAVGPREQPDALLADLPGYGYAAVERAAKLRWQEVMAEYLEDTKRAEEEEINYYDYGVQLTRGFRALKLWLSLKTFGAAAFRQAIEHGFALAEFAEHLVRQSNAWEVISPATMGIVAFRYLPHGTRSEDEINEINRRIVEAQVKDGFMFANSTTIKGHVVQRFCTINPRTTEDDVRAAIQKLEQLGSDLVRHQEQ